MAFAAGCGEGEFAESKTGLEYGFTTGGGDVNPDYYCGYKSDTKEFYKNDSLINFYYGTIHSSSYNGIYPDIEKISIHVFFANDYRRKSEFNLKQYDFEKDPYLFFIKEISDFFEGQYKVKIVYESDGLDAGYGHIQYSFSEILKIPEGVFIEESGLIYFCIEEYIKYENNPTPVYGSGGGASFYYKVLGDKVILSETPFEN